MEEAEEEEEEGHYMWEYELKNMTFSVVQNKLSTYLSWWTIAILCALIKLYNLKDWSFTVNASLPLWRIYGESAYEYNSPSIRNDRK